MFALPIMTPGAYVQPAMEIVPTPETAKLMGHLAAPVTKSGSFTAEMLKIHGQFLTAFGSEASQAARGLVLGTSAGAAAAALANWDKVSDATMALRTAHRGSRAALNEWGALGRAIRYVADVQGLTVGIGIPPGRMTTSRRKQAGGSMDLAALLSRQENGGFIHVTARMKAYFRHLADEAYDAFGGVNTDATTAYMSQQAKAYYIMSMARLGSQLVLPKRPVIRPAVDATFQKWEKTGLPQYAQRIVSLWTTGKTAVGMTVGMPAGGE